MFFSHTAHAPNSSLAPAFGFLVFLLFFFFQLCTTKSQRSDLAKQRRGLRLSRPSLSPLWWWERRTSRHKKPDLPQPHYKPPLPKVPEEHSVPCGQQFKQLGHGLSHQE